MLVQYNMHFSDSPPPHTHRTVLFRSPKDVHKCDIAVKGEPVDWESEEGEQLLKILPPSAKLINFRIAHEVAHLKSNDFVYHTLLSPAVLVCGYHFALFLSKCKCIFFQQHAYLRY